MVAKRHVAEPAGQEIMMNYLNAIPKFLFFTGKGGSEKPRFPAQRLFILLMTVNAFCWSVPTPRPM